MMSYHAPNGSSSNNNNANINRPPPPAAYSNLVDQYNANLYQASLFFPPLPPSSSEFQVPDPGTLAWRPSPPPGPYQPNQIYFDPNMIAASQPPPPLPTPPMLPNYDQQSPYMQPNFYPFLYSAPPPGSMISSGFYAPAASFPPDVPAASMYRIRQPLVRFNPNNGAQHPHSNNHYFQNRQPPRYRYQNRDRFAVGPPRQNRSNWNSYHQQKQLSVVAEQKSEFELTESAIASDQVEQPNLPTPGKESADQVGFFTSLWFRFQCVSVFSTAPGTNQPADDQNAAERHR